MAIPADEAFMEIDQQKLRQCFGAFMTGVTIVTTTDSHDKPIGFTANSFTSVSLTPPMLLVCIANGSENLSAYTKGCGFAVNVLASDQQDLSSRFASPIADRFESIAWQNSALGFPIFKDVAASFDCTLEQAIAAGDHTIMLGRIDNFSSADKLGLGYHRGQYFTRGDTA